MAPQASRKRKPRAPFSSVVSNAGRCTRLSPRARRRVRAEPPTRLRMVAVGKARSPSQMHNRSDTKLPDPLLLRNDVVVLLADTLDHAHPHVSRSHPARVALLYVGSRRCPHRDQITRMQREHISRVGQHFPDVVFHPPGIGVLLDLAV